MKVDREGPLHRSILRQLEIRLPGAVVHHSPNEFPGKGPMVASAIAKAKKNGMVVGFPDLIVIWQGQVAFIEVKAPGGRLSPGQIKTEGRLNANGFVLHVITDPDDTAAIAQELHEASSNWQPIGEVVTRVLSQNIEAAE